VTKEPQHIAAPNQRLMSGFVPHRNLRMAVYEGWINGPVKGAVKEV